MHVSIRTKTNHLLPTVSHEGKTYLIAPTEGEYEIVLYNNTSRRRMAVVAVDGMSVMDGKLAKKGDQNGYVLAPWQRSVIKGWRRTNEEVAAFAFTPNEGSYSNQIGNGTRNTGVISVAVFEEKEKPLPKPDQHHHHHYHHPWKWWYHRPYYGGLDTMVIGSPLLNSSNNTGGILRSHGERKSSATYSTASATASASPGATTNSNADLGTAYGSKTQMHVTTTIFDTASSSPDDIIVFYYGTRDRLRTQGIPVDKAPVEVRDPDPFPGSRCPEPPGWGG